MISFILFVRPCIIFGVGFFYVCKINVLDCYINRNLKVKFYLIMDNRVNNGNKGHSTKAKEGKIDKRKNEYREALKEACSKEDVIDVLRMLRDKAIKKQDTKASQIFLEYYLGKPNQSIDVTSNDETISIPIIKFTK